MLDSAQSPAPQSVHCSPCSPDQDGADKVFFVEHAGRQVETLPDEFMLPLVSSSDHLSDSCSAPDQPPVPLYLRGPMESEPELCPFCVYVPNVKVAKEEGAIVVTVSGEKITIDPGTQNTCPASCPIHFLYALALCHCPQGQGELDDITRVLGWYFPCFSGNHKNILPVILIGNSESHHGSKAPRKTTKEYLSPRISDGS